MTKENGSQNKDNDKRERLISIMVPVYNSASILGILASALEKERIEQGWNLEVVMVEDGSHDDSFNSIKKLKDEYPHLNIHGLKLSRNFGHQSAVSVGLKYCQGDYIGIVDDDMQDPPSLLPMLFSHLDQGYDVAYGVRRKRKESFLKVMAYKYFYKILRLLSEIDIPLDSGDFCVMKRPVVEAMLSLKERNPFLRGIRAWVGFKQIGVEYERDKRIAGESGYTLVKLFRVAFDGIFSFSNLPLRVTTVIGGIGLVFSFFYSIYVLGTFFIFGINVPGFTTIALLILIFGSLNLLSLGIVGEYLGRIYAEGKRRPLAIIAEEIK